MADIRKKIYSRFFFAEKNSKGFTLLEGLFAFFIISIGLMGIISLILQLMNLSSYVSSRLTAAYLAQEGIEIIRNVRDGNWLEGDDAFDGLFIACEGQPGCVVDYKHSYGPSMQDPNLPFFTGQYLKIDANKFYSYDNGTDTKFKRQVIIQSLLQSEAINVTVNVMWSGFGCPSGSCTFSVQNILHNWHHP